MLEGKATVASDGGVLILSMSAQITEKIYELIPSQSNLTKHDRRPAFDVPINNTVVVRQNHVCRNWRTIRNDHGYVVDTTYHPQTCIHRIYALYF